MEEVVVVVCGFFREAAIIGEPDNRPLFRPSPLSPSSTDGRGGHTKGDEGEVGSLEPFSSSSSCDECGSLLPKATY